MLAVLDPAVVPRLIAAAGPRMLIEEIPGADQHGTIGAPLLTMVRLLVGLQVEWIGRVDELLALGLPDWRPEPLTARPPMSLRERRPSSTRTSSERLERLLEGLRPALRRAWPLRTPDHARPRRLPPRATCGEPEIGSCCSTGATAASVTRCSTRPRSSSICRKRERAAVYAGVDAPLARRGAGLRP